MHRPPEEHLTSWLEAEGQGRDDAAEHALGMLFRSLPEISPGPGFAARVLAGAGIAEPSLTRRLEGRLREAMAALANASWGAPQRAAVALCLLLAGLSLAAVPGLALALSGSLLEGATLADAVELTLQFFTNGVEQWALALILIERLGGLYRAFLLVVTSPPVLAAWSVALIFSLLTLRWLKMILDRSSRDVAAS